MASYPCHQHASAFDQAARSRGHNNRRTALRPRRQQKATEVRLEQKMPTLLRVYIDGPHGMGKTTTTQLLVALGSRDDIRLRTRADDLLAGAGGFRDNREHLHHTTPPRPG
uniref:Truncated thymidine kinase n=1 Tax=Human herpesvirus 1 TaxID=10298 RepID=C0L332_HHV1|nr:truncated thymidine kinase [Human alphaherpesvirus 1]